MSSSVRTLAASGILALATILAPCAAAQDANVQRGFAPEKAYQSGDLDSVNLFNGNLVLTIPIGSGFTTDGGLSYRLVLAYNAQVWDVWNRADNGTDYVHAEPSHDSNAGLGFRLSLGDLYADGEPFNTTGRWVYIGEDGGQHVFYTSLHIGENVDAGVFYTRDGSYLRLKKVTEDGKIFEVESPDGTIRRFERGGGGWQFPFRLTEIRDRFGNRVTVAQGALSWTITDGARTHTVAFTTVANRKVVSSVDLAAFGGATATWTFAYTATQVQGNCLDDDDQTPAQPAVPLLRSVTLPAGAGSYRMDQADDYYLTCSDGTESIADLPGVLRRMKLPTGGSMEWTYQNYAYPSRGTFSPGEPSLERVRTVGVKTKRVLDAAGQCVTLDGVGCQWSYRWEPQPALGQERRTVVTSPFGDETVHHFSQIFGLSAAPSWTGWEYGLPIKKSSPSGAGFYLSQEIYDGPVSGGGKKRSLYLGYDHDRLPPTTVEPQDWYNTNRRVARQKTVFHDDLLQSVQVFAQEDFSEFDGVGHFRRRVLAGGFDSGNDRTETTLTNPARGTYTLGADNVVAAGYVPLPKDDPWVLGSATESWASEGGTVKAQTCFEKATGFLAWRRTYQNGSTQGSTDVLVRRTHDTKGDLIREEHFGGDSGGLPATAISDACTLSGLPAATSRIDHTYTQGALTTSQLYFANGTPMSFRSVNRVIDPKTGLPSQSTDPSGVVTGFEYDVLGRLTWAMPVSGHDAWTELQYASPTQVNVRRRANGSKNGAVLAESRIEFDAFGRKWKDWQKLPGVGWSVVATRYHATGAVFDVSERMANLPTQATKYLDYDPFGRPRTIRPVDSVSANGFIHDTHLIYNGTRVVTRRQRVGTTYDAPTQNVLETQVETVETYDRQGRLWRVREPGVAGASATDTKYLYDVGHRLVQVAMAPQGGATVQTRSFSYDGRGFLKWENHPEKTANVRGLGHDVDYDNYDALGRAGRRVDGASDLTFSYDRAGRLTQVRETAGAQRVLKTFTYGTSNGAGNWNNAKLVASRRYNYVLLGMTPVTVEIAETTTYGGKGGRMSQRDLAAWVGGAATEGFTQGWTYDELGAPVATSYPRCAQTGTHPFPACTAAAQAPRTVTATYTDGALTAIPGYTGTVAGQPAGVGITYHLAGLPNQIAHANGVTDTQTLDPTGRSRPGSLGSALGAATRWASGAYLYDGAGNVTEIGTSWFTYDELSRIETATVWTGPVGGSLQKQQTYTFDRYGNLTAIAGSPDPGRSTPTNASTNRLTGATYDAAGNVTGWNGAVYEWDAFQMMWRFQSGAENWLYLYNADDERVWSFKVGANWSRWTLRGLADEVLREYVNNAGVWTVDRDYVYREGRLLAAETPQGRRHFHLDHLGTPRLITDGMGSQVAFHVYYPFGEEATAFNQDAERMKFTGHERDLGSTAGAGDDLDYMHARHCSPVTGRFLSFDPVGGNPRLPQSWNRYAYVANRPLNYTDPTGLLGASMAGMLRWISVVRSVGYFESITVNGTAVVSGPGADWSSYMRFLYGPIPGYVSGITGEGPSTGYGLLNVDRARAFYEVQSDSSEGLWEIYFYEVLLDLVPQSQGELGVEIAMTVLPPTRLVRVAELSNKPVRDLISGTLKRSGSYHEELASFTYGEIVKISQGRGAAAQAAKQMKKLVDQGARLIDKVHGKP